MPPSATQRSRPALHSKLHFSNHFCIIACTTHVNMASAWNPENVEDIAESIGIANLSNDALQSMTADIEFRLCQVLEEALKFMRHGKRTTLHTQDVAQALRVLDVEPLYGYESTRPLRFGEASIGPGLPLFYVEDEEMDFERLINQPLPKVPREISFTGMKKAASQ